MKKPMTEVINRTFPSLTNSEQKVASFVLNNLDQVMYFSVTDLADKAAVGETTVLRFCRKIGLKGFQEFKLTIAQNLSEADQEKEPLESNNLVQTILTNTMKSLDNTASMIQEQSLNGAIDLLDQARTIHFFGVGTSALTAQDAKSRLLKIGIFSHAIADPHLQAMSAAALTNEDVVIALSISGSTRDTLESLEIAKNAGAKIIAITYYHRSPITQFADIVLPGGAVESPLEGGSLTGKISQLFVVDLLYTGLALRRKDEVLKMKNKTAQAVVNKIY